MKSDSAVSISKRRHLWIWVIFIITVMSVLAFKSINDGWFAAKPPLELNGEPAFVFFTLKRGCECQMSVVWAAEVQLAAWQVTKDKTIPILWVDFSRRPDLTRQYGVARAPALVLLDGSGQVIWKQDVGLSDEAPLDLEHAKDQVERLFSDDT